MSIVVIQLQNSLKSYVVPQNKFQQAKRVEITPLIFTGHEKKKLKVNKNLENFFFSLRLGT